MEVDLLTNALLPNVEAASGGVEPMGAKPVGGSPGDSHVAIEQGEVVAGEDNQIITSSNAVNGKPSKDFAKTLEEKMQAETPHAPENAEAVVVAPDVANASLPDQSEVIASEAVADLFAEVAKISAQTPDIPQEQVVSGDSQLLTSGAVIPMPREITGAQVEAAAIPATAESSGELTALTAENSQVQPQTGQISQGMPEVTADTEVAQIAQVAQVSQPGRQDATNDGVVAEGETIGQENTEELLNKSLGKGDSAVVPDQKVGDAIGRAVPGADPTTQNSADAGKEASSDSHGDTAKSQPVVTLEAFAEAQARVDTKEQTETLPQSSENSGGEVFGKEEAELLEPGVQKLDSLYVESVLSKSNTPESSAPKADESPKSEQAVPTETPQQSVPEQPLSVRPPNAPASPNPMPPENSAAISRQIRESITSSNVGPDREITIRLNPPELGTVVVKFQEQEDQITGLLEVSKTQTRAEIQQLLPEITRDLQDFGVQIKRIEVVMASEHESETLSGQSPMPQHDHWAGREGPGGSDLHPRNTSVGGVFAQSTPHGGSGLYSRSYVTDKSIDMFV